MGDKKEFDVAKEKALKKPEPEGDCKNCPYNEPQYVEEIEGYICEGLLMTGDCYLAREEEALW